jgi:hypothetical protein
MNTSKKVENPVDSICRGSESHEGNARDEFCTFEGVTTRPIKTIVHQR